VKQSLRAAGQRVMVGFEGMTASTEVRQLVRDYGAGGVLLFARNVDSPEQVADLVRELQAIAREAGHELPLLVAVDQEGGRVARLRAPWIVWPPLRALGRTGSPDLAYRMGQAFGEELSACGIHWDFAPSVDVDTNPANPVIGDRALSGNPAEVGRLGAAFVRGIQSQRVAACGKHFPGHGDTDLDSHLALPVVEHAKARLEEVELLPFREIIEAGVASIMSGHLLVRALDDEMPATLSSKVLDQLLRKGMGFAGVVVSDDLEMKGIAARWPAGEAGQLAARAGCDVITVSQTPDAQVAAIEALVLAVESGAIGFRAMDEAASRVRQLKSTYALPYRDPDPQQARRAAGPGEHQALAQEILKGSGLTA
jgi:beta-N-acetylhexosaminidase